MLIFLSLSLQLIVTLTVFPRDVAFALCPSNGNTHVVYITSNMGSNIWSFDTSGRYIGHVLNKSSFPFQIEKLRDMKFGPGNHLYISSARGELSRIFAVSGNGLLNRTINEGCTRNFLFTVTTQSATNPFLDHPYAMAFNPDDDSLFVSNQNSVTVTKYKRTDNGKIRFPKWSPVRNNKHALSNTSEMRNIPSDAGLFVSSWSSEYTVSSVRGLAISPPLPRVLVEKGAPSGWFATGDGILTRYLLVSDIAMDRVHVFYLDTGVHVFSMPVPSPVQLLFPSQYQKVVNASKSYFDVPYVYVSSKEDGMTYLMPFVMPQSQGDVFGTIGRRQRWSLHPVTKRTPQHSSSGIYENPAHDMLLIADRIGRRISTFASPFAAGKEGASVLGSSPFLGYFAPRLPDQPEFVLITMVEQQRSIPFCYELNEDGNFHYVALCTAGYVWSIVLFFFCLILLMVLLVRGVGHCVALGTQKKSIYRKSSVLSSEEIPLVGMSEGINYGSKS